MKYVHLFETDAQYQQKRNNDYNEPWVSYTEETDEVNYNKQGPNANGHEYVDLGLPSGILWATCNVGADSPEEYGGYYAWGELATKSDYSWSTYRFGESSPFSKYDTDGKTELELVDDVARTEWGGDWKMPTQANLQELIDNTDSVWTTQNGFKGRLFTSTVNGNSIFIPAAGDRYGTAQYGVGTSCYLWSSSLLTDHVHYGVDLNFSSGNVNMNSDYYRCNGFSVRGVLVP